MYACVRVTPMYVRFTPMYASRICIHESRLCIYESGAPHLYRYAHFWMPCIYTFSNAFYFIRTNTAKYKRMIKRIIKRTHYTYEHTGELGPPFCIRVVVHRCRYCLQQGDSLHSVAVTWGTNWLNIWAGNAHISTPSHPLEGTLVQLGCVLAYISTTCVCIFLVMNDYACIYLAMDDLYLQLQLQLQLHFNDLDVPSDVVRLVGEFVCEMLCSMVEVSQCFTICSHGGALVYARWCKKSIAARSMKHAIPQKHLWLIFVLFHKHTCDEFVKHRPIYRAVEHDSVHTLAARMGVPTSRLLEWNPDIALAPKLGGNLSLAVDQEVCVLPSTCIIWCDDP